MEISSFSHYLSNLLIGLSKGSRVLEPYSLEFRDRLGYQLFRLEASFKLVLGGRSNPDLILISERVANSLLFEWTAATGVGDRKKDQFQHYSKISSSDLTEVLAIPPAAAHTHNVVLVAMPEAIDSFKEFFRERGKFVLTDLARRSLGRELLARATENPPSWRLIGSVEFKRRMRSFRRFLDGFIDERQGKTYQPELPLDEP